MDSLAAHAYLYIHKVPKYVHAGVTLISFRTTSVKRVVAGAVAIGPFRCYAFTPITRYTGSTVLRRTYSPTNLICLVSVFVCIHNTYLDRFGRWRDGRDGAKPRGRDRLDRLEAFGIRPKMTITSGWPSVRPYLLSVCSSTGRRRGPGPGTK